MDGQSWNWVTRPGKINKFATKYKPRKKEIVMRSQKKRSFYSLFAMTGMLVSISPSGVAETSATATVPVKMTVTASVADDKRMPEIKRQDVLVKRGNERLQVTDWVPAQGKSAGLDLFILIDDASDPGLGSQFDDLRAFIVSQPSTTSVGVGYMRNTTVQIVQDPTTDHDSAARALRLPFGSTSAFGSPYYSVIDLMHRWPDSQNRREVVMVTDGIDRTHSRVGFRRGLTVNPDVDLASSVAQRTGTMIHTIYAPGVGRLRRNYWEATNGQMNIARLSEQTGGESFYLGLQSAVSFQPYLSDLQKIFDNQYLVSFAATPGKEAGLQNVTLSTEVAGVEFATHDAVWVPAAK
jgi:hypothetical protein